MATSCWQNMSKHPLKPRSAWCPPILVVSFAGGWDEYVSSSIGIYWLIECQT